MRFKTKNYTRRTFIDRTIKGTIGILTGPFIINASKNSQASPMVKSTVVIVNDETILGSSRIDQFAAQVMVDAGIKRVTNIQDIGEAWKSLFSGIKSSSTISIKVNCINSSLSSHPEVAYSIVNGLTRMQVEGNPFPENNIIIWDRTNGELRNAGYSINTGSSGVRCFGTSQSAVGYSNTQFNVAGRSQRISRILTDMSDYMINLSVLKNHDTSGVTFSLKNHYGTCHDPGSLHSGYCDPYIPALNNLSPVREKQVINICDAIYGIVSGGPSGNPQITPKSLIISKDPVAHDYIAAQMLKDNGCNTLNRARHIETAAKAPYSLGISDPNQIDVIPIDNPTTAISEMPTENKNSPDDFQLFQNYPNPFNAQTILSYQLSRSVQVSLDIYNIRGEHVNQLVDSYQNVGIYRISWHGKTSSGTAVPGGTYLGKLQIGGFHQVIKMQLIK